MTGRDGPPDGDGPRSVTADETGESPDDERAARDPVAVRSDLPVHRCRRCGRPFAEESLLALHRGLAHADALADDEVAAFREAYAEENRSLRRLRLGALAGLVVLYFALLAAYALV